MNVLRYPSILGCLLLLTAIPNLSQAQSWQWGASFGGVKPNGLYYVRPFSEGFTSIATDKNGNVYGVGKISDSLRAIAGQSLSSSGSSDVLLASFNCDGQLRWTKVISGPTDGDELVAVRCDTLGGVYIAGSMVMNSGSGSAGRFDADTTVGATPRTMFLVKYDTAGRYQWLRFPQPDTTNHQKAVAGEALMDMDVTPVGDIHLFAMLATGRYGGSYVVSAPGGAHVLKYDQGGRFTGGVPLQQSTPYIYPSSYTTFRFMFDPTRDRYFQSGFATPRMTFGTTTTSGSAGFIASWSAATGALNWYKSSNNGGMLLQSQAVLQDGSGDIVVGGNVIDGTMFNGLRFTNPGSGRPRPFVARLKGLDGTVIWSLDCQTTSTSTTINGLATTPDGRVFAVGDIVRELRFPGAPALNISATDSTDILALVINGGTGAPIAAMHLGGPGTADVAICVAADRRNNLYLGGSFGREDITIAGKVLEGNRHSVSSNTLEGFVAKYGRSNCGCPLPAPSFTATGNGLSIRYTYTAAVTGLDSLVWHWGDGQRQTVRSGFAAPVSHTFPTNSPHTTCVTAYGTGCGSKQICKPAPLDAGHAAAGAALRIYPNPTAGMLQLEAPVRGSYRLFNTAGKTVQHGRVSAGRQELDLEGLPAGIYRLVFQDGEGNQESLNVLRQ